MTGSVDPDAMRQAELETALRGSIATVAWDIAESPVRLARALDSEFRVRPHTRVMSDAIQSLDPTHPDHCNRVLLTVPPQSGKSTLVEWGVFWWLIQHPGDRIIISSYSSELATLRSRNVRELVRAYGELFHLRLSRHVANVDMWDLATGGGCRAASLGSSITGFSADMLVVDDYHRDRREANSATMREHVWDWWVSVAKNRLQPGSPVIMPSTAWHPDDIRGRLLRLEGRVEDGGQWRVIHLPALADPARFGPDPLGRAEGEPLSHPKTPTSDQAALLQHWRERRGDYMQHVPASVTREWESLFQGDPQPQGESLVSPELVADLHDPHNVAPARKTAVAVDPSGGGRDAAGIIAGHLGTDGRLWVTHDWSVEGPSEVWSRLVAKLAVEVDADLVYVETNYGGDMCTRVVGTAWEELQRNGDVPPGRLMPRVESVKSRQGKELRAEPVTQQMGMDKVRLAALANGHLANVAREWLTWRPGDTLSPGRIDAMTHLAFGLLPMPQQGGKVTSTAGVSMRNYGIRRR